MNVNIQTQRFDADSKLVTFIEKKLSKLVQYNDRITKIDVYLKLENVTHKVKDKVAEIKVHIPYRCGAGFSHYTDKKKEGKNSRLRQYSVIFLNPYKL